MAWGAVLGGLAGAAGGLAGIFDGSGDDAADAMEAAQARMEARQRAAIEDIEGSVDDYLSRLDQIDAEFDPYNMEQAYASFYEGVILPMERDFDEFVIPSVHAAYSGGVFGPESYQSGAAKEAELKARRELSLAQGSLKAEERQNVIQQNFQKTALDREGAASRLSASTIAPQLEFGAAESAFTGEQSVISARYAADQARLESILSLPSSIISGAQAGGSIQEGINRVFGGQNQRLPNPPTAQIFDPSRPVG